MPTITIGTTDYEVYGDLDEALEYLAADANAATFRDAEEVDQQRWLVTATRIIDRQIYAGEKTDEDQTAAFPRSGISGYDEDEVPQAVIWAEFELANAMANGWDAANVQSTAQTTRRLKAGSVEIEYFRGAEGEAFRLPLPVTELLSAFFGSSSALAGSLAYGTCLDSIFDEDWSLSGGI